MYETLIKSPIFKGLHEVQIKNLLSDIFYKVKSFNKASLIAEQDEVVESQMILLKGHVRGEMVDFSGKVVIIEVIYPGQALAPAFIFGKRNTFPVNVVAQTEVEVLVIPKDSLIKLLQKDNVFLKNYLSILSGKAQFLAYKLRFLSFNTIKAKFAFYILNELKDKSDKKLVIPTTQSKLAELFAVTRPSLTRAIREMHNDKIIYAKGKNIEIININKLYELM